MKRIILLLCILFLPGIVSAATLTMGGPSQVVAGDTFSVPVYLSTAVGESANAVSADVNFPSQLLTLVAISKAGSIITLWPQEPSKSASSAQFEGVILNPGWSGTNGTVVTLTFQAKTSGSVALVFTDASVLANDGQGTNILSAAPSRAVTVSPTPTTPVQTTPKPETLTPAPKPASTPTPAPETQQPQEIITETPPVTQFALDYFSLGFVVLVGLILAVLLLRLAWHGYQVLHKKLRGRVGHSHSLLHKQFSELKEALSEEVATLEKVRSQRDLTTEEERFLNRFNKLLDKAEHVIEKEIIH